MMGVPASLLAAFPPSADLLLDCARRKTDDEMLMEIARADYGMGADEVMLELRPIRDRGVFSLPLSGTLGEVLSLTHYADPDVPNVPLFETGPTGRRGHQTRLFACALLLRVEADLPRESRLVWDSALAQCLVSARVLDEEMSAAAASFLTWWMGREEVGVDSLPGALGLLVLAVRLRSGRFTEPGLKEVAGWVLGLEWLENAKLSSYLEGPMPLSFGVHAGFWQPLVDELRNEAASLRDREIGTDLELCGLLLDEGE